MYNNVCKNICLPGTIFIGQYVGRDYHSRPITAMYILPTIYGLKTAQTIMRKAREVLSISSAGISAFNSSSK